MEPFSPIRKPLGLPLFLQPSLGNEGTENGIKHHEFSPAR